MSWTLNLFLLLGSVVLLTYLHRGIQKLRKNAFVYPSEAIIDQLIPPEIMEQIVLNTDYQTLMACSVVSKYWHYHAAKDHVQDFVYRNDNSLEFNDAELRRTLSRTYVDWAAVPCTWPDTYPPKYRVEDRYFAARQNKILMETTLRGARSIAHALNTDKNPIIDMYLVKLRCKLRYGWTNYWSLEDIASNHSFSINDTLVADCQKYEFTEGLECDVIMDMKSVWNDRGDFTMGIKRLRMLDNRPQIVGFPVSSVLLQILVILIMPCLLVDYFNSSAHEVKYYAKVIFALGFELIAIFLAINEHIPNDDGSAAVKKKRRNGRLGGIFLILFGAVFYRWSLELALYVAILGVSAAYYLIWEFFLFKRYKYAMLVGAIAACMVISMNDWKLTVDAFKSGKILWTFLQNALLHAQLGGIFTLHNGLMVYFRGSYSRTSVTFKEYLVWQEPMYKTMMLHGLTALAFVTLYAPLTTYRIF